MASKREVEKGHKGAARKGRGRNSGGLTTLVYTDTEAAKRVLNESLRAEEEAEKANTRQVGGTHYKVAGFSEGKDFEVWDAWAAWELDTFQGTIVKHVVRWRKKGGLQDLEKARHYLDKYIELVKEGKVK